MHPSTELKHLLLREPALTLAAAESLTCGHVQARIGEASGASGYFLGGVTAYSLEQKVKLLGVERATAAPANSVSREVAEQMARGACIMFGSDLAVATTGYAEPSIDAGAEMPHAWWALHHKRRGRPVVLSGLVQFPGAGRTEMQAAVADTVLRELVQYLREFRQKKPRR